MWPVLVGSLKKVHMDMTVSEGTRALAGLASWVMRDGRVFLAMRNVMAALDTMVALSLSLFLHFQDADSIAINDMESGRAHALLDGS